MHGATRGAMQAHARLNELADFFSGERALTRVGKDEQLVGWFQQLAAQVEALHSADATLAGRKMHHLIAALSEVEQFHQLEQSLQIKQFLAETRALLSRMVRVVNIRDNVRRLVQTGRACFPSLPTAHRPARSP